jgi:GAF domain-containing protein
LAAALSDAARTWKAAPDVLATVEAIARAAVDELAGVEHAGVTLVKRGKIETLAASSQIVIDLDKLQQKTGEGPCLDAIEHHVTYRTGDLDSETRWPTFSCEAAGLGIRSILTYRLFVSDTTLGALTLASSQQDAFDTDAEEGGRVFASHAAIALHSAQTEAQLGVALDNRDQIGMAKGILMRDHQVDPAQAFAMLIDASQAANMKLHEVAAWLVEYRDDLNRPPSLA